MESKATEQHCAVTGHGSAGVSTRLVEPLVLAAASMQESNFRVITLVAPGQRQHTLLIY